jgi:lysyl-tRNA synthetase class 2
MQVRRDKVEKLRECGYTPYAERYERTHTLAQAFSCEEGTTGIAVAGRVMALRHFGKLMFGHLQDASGRLQFAVQKKQMQERFDHIKQLVDIGDHIGIQGEMFVTKKGEKTINVESWTFLSKALRPLPEKFHGLTDVETRFRQRYLDLTMNTESRKRFMKRSEIIKTIRTFLDDHDFLEVDTPVLQSKASGAMATPFKTHHNYFDMDVYLRIAPETYLKRAVAGGLDKVYEFARCFRNEGVDPSHLPDFTLLEYYCAYWNYADNMDFTEKLLTHLLTRVNGALELTYQDHAIDFSGPWPRISFRELLHKDCGVDIAAVSSKDELLDQIRARGIELSEDIDVQAAGFGTLIDTLYKKVSRPSLINPTFITHHPIDLSPLARKNDTDGGVVDRFQLVVNGWEIVNAYSELIDPIDQYRRFELQAQARSRGDTEAMDMDMDFIRCMEYGMPPISGWGMGIDRLVALMTDTTSLRDVVLFPLMKPEERND